MSDTQEGKTIRKVLQTEMDAANIDYDVMLAPGSYHLSLAVDGFVTGTTTVITARPIVNGNPLAVGKVDIQMGEPDDATAIVSLALAAADEGRFVHLGVFPAGVPSLNPTVLPYGLQVSVAKGGATTGEKCKIVLTATKVA